MPLPTLIGLAFASGVAAALAARMELRNSPRPPVFTRSFGAYCFFAFLVLVPTGVYFYVFHGDWFLLYTIDVRKIPSALALIGFLFVAGFGAAGFGIGANIVRGQREVLGAILVTLLLLASFGIVLANRDRLSVVGTFSQYEGEFGLQPYSQSAVFRGTMAMGGLLLTGLVFLIFRLHMSGRRRV